MPSLWYRLSERIRNKLRKRRNRRRHKHSGRVHGASNDCGNAAYSIKDPSKLESDKSKFSLPKNHETCRPKLTNLFPNLDIGGEGEVYKSSHENNNNESRSGGMLVYVPRVTQEMCMSQILYGAKFEDCLQRCRSDHDLDTFGMLDYVQPRSRQPPTPLEEDNNGFKINIKQWSNRNVLKKESHDEVSGIDHTARYNTVTDHDSGSLPSLPRPDHVYVFGGGDEELLY